MSLPNVRELFLPDPDHVMFECDLKGADAQVVAWEADDEDLKAAFRAGIDVHSKNAKDIFDDPQIQRATLEEIANLPHLKNSWEQLGTVGNSWNTWNMSGAGRGPA